MIDLRNKSLPNAISANGELFLLNTDYRLWIQFGYDLEHDSEDRDISYLFVDEAPQITDEVLRQLQAFYYNPSSTPRSGSSGEKVLDYVEDGEYIFSAIYATYGIDIMECDMHWHKFQALCNNIIGESTLWGYAKQMRGYVKPSKNDSYDKQCQKARLAWELPIELTQEEKEKISEFDDYFS